MAGEAAAALLLVEGALGTASPPDPPEAPRLSPAVAGVLGSAHAAVARSRSRSTAKATRLRFVEYRFMIEKLVHHTG
jgi:hypothetical protein